MLLRYTKMISEDDTVLTPPPTGVKNPVVTQCIAYVHIHEYKNMFYILYPIQNVARRHPNYQK